MDSLLPGRKPHPRFKLVRRLAGKALSGSGTEPWARNQPEVWLVHDEELDELMVAKMVPPETPADRITLLKQACKRARKLVHPNIVPVYDFHRGDESSFVTMAAVDGLALSELERRSLEEILQSLIPVADAIDYAHRQGVVHGALGPGSIVLDDSGTPRIADFAVGRHLSAGASVEEPTVADDVRAFGDLLYRLVTGTEYREGPLPHSVPESLRGFLSATLGPDPARRPQSMAEVRQKLEAAREQPARSMRVKVTPPPVAREVRPIAPGPGPGPGFVSLTSTSSSADASAVAKEYGRALGPKTLAAFLFLLGTAFAVFVLLPRWMQEKSTNATAMPPAGSGSSHGAGATEDAATPAPDLRALAEEKTKAEQAQERASRLRNALESRGVVRWGGDDYPEGVERLSSGERKMTARDYAGALAEAEAASRSFEKLESRARIVLAETLSKAKQALAGGRSAEAIESFQLALQVAPESREAASGLERAKHLDEVLALLAAGEARENKGDLEGAAERYRRAVSLDPLSTTAQKALSRVDAKASEEAFAAAMSEALAALDRKDYASARAAFERAGAIRPQAPEVANGLSQVADGLRVQAIAAHRDRARALEAAEDWHQAEAEYDKALALDPALRFAQEGKKRTAARALLQDRLEFQISHPERLSDGNALKEASSLLDEARSVEPSGPKHRAQVSKLESLVASSSTPVEVQILSDRLTEVTIYRVGKLGKFDRRALELRPGRYTVVGTREGYRDVRRELVVEAGKPPEPVLVRCEEKI